VVCDFTSSAVPCPTAGEFIITATTGNGSSYTFPGSESGTPLTINPPFPATYQVTETTTPPSEDVEFDTTTSGDCSGVITTADQDLTCTITNTATLRTSTLNVIKNVVCDFAPSAVACPTANQFTITATTGNGSTYTFSGSESGTTLTINPPFPATYQITETSPTQGFVISTIPVGVLPSGIVFNPNNGFMYVANEGSNSVSVINPATNTVVATIPIASPRDIVFNSNNGFLYVANGNTVSVINPATNTVVATIPVGSQPTGIAFNTNNGFLYVANVGSNTVSVINPTTNTVVATIPVGVLPFGIAFNPNNGFMYVTNIVSNTVSVINPATNTVVATISLPAGSGPKYIAFNPNNGFMYVTNQNINSVSVINPATNTVVATIPVGASPQGVAFNPNNGFMYVTNQFSNSVSVINPATNTVVATIPVGMRPMDIAFNPNNGFMYVTNFGSNTVSVIAPLTTTFSEGCNGTISNGDQTATCTITNTYGRP
jgi:YVTN family beta-propeller protein